MTNFKDHGIQADKAFADYDFGSSVVVTDSSGWEYLTPGHERSRKVYVETEREDDGPAPSWALTFTVLFDPVTGDLTEAYALDDKGQKWGSMPGTPEADALPEPVAIPLEVSTTDDLPEIGVSSNGFFVTNPFFDVGMFDSVDPMDCWGISHGQAKLIVSLNRELGEAVEDAINAACLRLQNVAGITDGGHAGLHFSDRNLRCKLMIVFAEYIVGDINTNGFLSREFSLSKEQIDTAISGHNLRTYDGWMAAVKALLQDAPSWTAIRCNETLCVKATVDSTLGVFSCHEHDNPNHVYGIGDLADFDRSAWTGFSWDGMTVENCEGSLKTPSFVSLRFKT